ncbi:MAG: ABC transporter ATP-binding protein [Lachnospiraceae bacterium]|nr:ABC transporter ATP-binding protein [Lachnospiraceae bacterium]
MIAISNVSKQFGEVKALDSITATIGEGQVFGLIGTNGAGKSTLMRILSGVMKPDSGEVTMDDAPIYENPTRKSEIFFISDDQYFFGNGTPQEMLRYYQTFYPHFDLEQFKKLMTILGLDEKRKINTFSKGMKKQLSVIFGLCAGTKYLLCDETFDGLDPVMRQTVKNMFIQEMDARGLTPIIASHNLRELEDICDHVGLLHKGGILFSRDLDEMKLGIHKLQCVLGNDTDYEKAFTDMEILKKETRGSLLTLTIRGQRGQIETIMRGLCPIFYEVLPLSLEEIFISETEVKGYDFKNLIL